GDRHRLRVLAKIPVIPRAAAACVLAAAAVCACATPVPSASAPSGIASPSGVTAGCQRAFVPAFFSASSGWAEAIDTRPAPRVMFLNINSGPGTAPDPHFQALVRQAQAAGIAVLGYSSTNYGQRPIGSVETEVRQYRAWYRVNGMFLDVIQGTPGELPYYRALASPIRAALGGPAPRGRAACGHLVESRHLPRPELHVGGRRGDGVRGLLRPVPLRPGPRLDQPVPAEPVRARHLRDAGVGPGQSHQHVR